MKPRFANLDVFKLFMSWASFGQERYYPTFYSVNILVLPLMFLPFIYPVSRFGYGVKIFKILGVSFH